MSGRTLTLLVLGLALAVGLSLTSRLAHTATMPNVGLPPSNSKIVPKLAIYDPQVEVTRQYLQDLVRLDYSAAYALLAPSIRGTLTADRFAADRRAEGVLGQPAVWADDETSVRAEYVLGKPDGSRVSRRHRFLLASDQGEWRIVGETAIPDGQSPAPNLQAAMNGYVLQQAGKVWANTAELLRQEAFESGQLLLFSYIEPRPPGVLTQERIAILTYFVNGPDGWEYQGGGTVGPPAAMGVADVAMGFTAFGPDRRYTAYFGVVENKNATSLAFQEPNGVRHRQSLTGESTILYVNESNPYEDPPLEQPFKSIEVKDALGNTMRSNPPLPPTAS